MKIREYTKKDVESLREIWNQVVEDGVAFPQDEPLSPEEAEEFFSGQSYVGVAEKEGRVIGLYILHPNNVGRCGHIANASYAVRRDVRGEHIGEKLVRDSLAKAAELSFRVLQFNAVVASNTWAIHLYEKLGFVHLGRIPGGFKLKDGTYEDILPFYIELSKYEE